MLILFSFSTGEKTYQCPHMVSVVGSPESPSHEERCEYKTNDPAALTKHRKKVHGYIPPPNRSRPSKAASASPCKPRKPRQKRDGKVSRRPRSPVSISCHKPSLVPCMANPSSIGAEYTSPSFNSTTEISPFLWQGDEDAYGQCMDANYSDVSGNDFSISSNATLVVPEDEMDLATPSFDSEWTGRYEMGYSMFDMTGMKHVPSSAPASLDMQTDRGGCLCPEWMVEAGIEGWDQSVLDAHKEFYAFDA